MFGDLLRILETEMTRPKPFGLFHWAWIFLIVITLLFLREKNGDYSEKKLKCVLGTYSIVAFILEFLKQIIYSIEYIISTGSFVWDYQWYAAPFQLCTTPIYACLICFCLDEKSRLRAHLLSYVAFITILGSIATLIIPTDCFTITIIVNIHTSWMHFGSLVVSVYLIMSGAVKLTANNLKRAIKTFIVFVCIAQLLNLGVYQSGVLNGETFNMFYISPYFVSSLPVFNIIYQNVPYLIFLLAYIVALSFGAAIVFEIESVIKNKKFSNMINRSGCYE